VEASNNATAAADAVRETFVAFLTGPSLKSEPLKARLESQVKEEAKQAACPYLLLTTLKLATKRSGGGLLGQVAAGAVRQGAWEAGATSGSAAGRIAGSAAYGGINQAAYTYAATIRNKDEVSLEQGRGLAGLAPGGGERNGAPREAREAERQVRRREFAHAAGPAGGGTDRRLRKAMSGAASASRRFPMTIRASSSSRPRSREKPMGLPLW
jgi:hypothetical protein